jgi:hypothetical protein
MRSGGGYGYSPSSIPMASTTKMVKCVQLQYEDTKTDPDPIVITETVLEMTIRAPVGGSCGGGGGAAVSPTRSDSFIDWKHMVSFTDSEVTLAGNCVSVEVAYWNAPSTTNHVMCYAAGVLDDEPS